MKPDFVRLLRRLSEAHGAPGSEGPVRQLLTAELGGNLSVDRVGSLVCERRGTAAAPRVMLAAHLDEVALAVQHVTAEGLLAVVPLGSWWGHVLLGQRLRLLTRRGIEVPGVVVSKPPHLLHDAERDKVVKPEDMLVDVGAVDATAVRERFGIAPGDPAVPDSPFRRLPHGDRLLGKAFDDRAGVAVMIEAVRELDRVGHPNRLFAVGTVQEEVGVRGAVTAAQQVAPDVALVLEGTPADDGPGTAPAARQGALGHGVQVRLVDPSALMNRGLNDLVLDAARQHGVPVQVAVRRSGGTDAKAIHLHGCGVPTTVLGVPVRYAHAHHGIVSLTDCLAAVRLVVEVVRRLDVETVAGLTALQPPPPPVKRGRAGRV